MLVENQVLEFVKQNYQQQLVKQVPALYDPKEALLTLTLTIDLAKVLQSDKDMGVFIVSNYPTFYEASHQAIPEVLKAEGIDPPEHGIHLLVNLINCPIPEHQIHSPEFILAASEQKQGILAYFKNATVQKIGQGELYLLSYVQIFTRKCSCEQAEEQIRVKKYQNLLTVIQKVNYSLKKSCEQTVPPVCRNCGSLYGIGQRTCEMYRNCYKMKLMVNNQGNMFGGEQLSVIVEEVPGMRIRVGMHINCCLYLMCKIKIPKLQIKAKVFVIPSFMGYLISLSVPKLKNSLLLNSKNNKFFNNLRQIDIEQRSCYGLDDVQPLIFNYHRLIEAIERIKFPTLPDNSYLLFKLSILNSIFNHHDRCNFHLCIIADEYDLVLRAMQLNNLETKKWPTKYDEATLFNFLFACKNSIVIVSNPTKKECELITNVIRKRYPSLEELTSTFWVVSEERIHKELGLEDFGIVINLTYHKNLYVCKGTYEKDVETLLEGFQLAAPEDFFLHTMHKVKPGRHRIMLQQELQNRDEDEQQQQDGISRTALQQYYMKCREYKKIPEKTLPLLMRLAKGFALFRTFLLTKSFHPNPYISLLDTMLTIFIHEETSRHIYQESNTLFANQISKILLNSEECEISFWQLELEEDGTMKEYKTHVDKVSMMKRMLQKVHNLLFGDGLVIYD